MIRIALSFVFVLTCITVAYACPGPPCQRAVLDFDGDNKTDFVLARNSGGGSPSWNWYLQESTAGFQSRSFGSAGTDLFVPGDYDGDGKWDLATWRNTNPSTFYILQSSNGALRAFQWGVPSDDPTMTQDFDGDGKADPTVVRAVGANWVWYISQSQLGLKIVTFGTSSSDYPIRGDFDGDGKADVAYYRGVNGNPAFTFLVLRSSDGNIQGRTLGNVGGIMGQDIIFPGDFDGDGKTDYAVWGLATGAWVWVQSSDGSSHTFNFGTQSDQPVPGDYDGDGKTDQAVWRHGTTHFYVNRSSAGFLDFPFGISSDYPVGYFLQVKP